MKSAHQLLFVVLSGLFCMSAAHAAGNFVQSSGAQNTDVRASHYNPWRPQPRQWGYQKNSNGNAHRDSGQARYITHRPRYAIPLSHIPARQFEYRRYVQEVTPYYNTGGGLPWWAGSGAAPYGPWAIGNGWPNGIW